MHGGSSDDARRALVLDPLGSIEPWDWLRAQLRRMRWRPTLLRHERALLELATDHRLDVHTIAGLANTAHAAYRRRGIRLRTVRARWLAHELDVVALPDPNARTAKYDPDTRVLVYPPGRNARDEELDVFHELGEAAVGRRGAHGDVWTMSCALAVEQGVMEAAINLHGFAGALDVVVRRYRNVPAWTAACGGAFWAYVALAQSI